MERMSTGVISGSKLTWRLVFPRTQPQNDIEATEVLGSQEAWARDNRIRIYPQLFPNNIVLSLLYLRAPPVRMVHLTRLIASCPVETIRRAMVIQSTLLLFGCGSVTMHAMKLDGMTLYFGVGVARQPIGYYCMVTLIPHLSDCLQPPDHRWQTLTSEQDMWLWYRESRCYWVTMSQHRVSCQICSQWSTWIYLNNIENIFHNIFQIDYPYSLSITLMGTWESYDWIHCECN